MIDVLISSIIGLICGLLVGYFAYRAGVHDERANHYRWMSEGYRLAADHIDFLMIAQPIQEEALRQHLIYMTDVFGTNRPYPPKKEKEGTIS